MANRMLRDWTTSEKINNLSELAELFFVRLIMKADDHGCFHANPKLLKAALFPLRDYTETQMMDCLYELSNNDIIEVYEHENREYLKIYDFGQRLRTMVSKFPQPADNCQQSADNARPEVEEKRSRREVEEKVQIFGDSNEKSFIIVQSQIVNSPIYKIHGVSGLNDFLQSQMSVLNYPEHAPKFMARKHGDRYNDMQHLRNAYAKFVEKQYA